jgi:hypothetical protein
MARHARRANAPSRMTENTSLTGTPTVWLRTASACLSEAPGPHPRHEASIVSRAAQALVRWLPLGLVRDTFARTIGALADGRVLEYVVGGGSLQLEDAHNCIRVLLGALIQGAAAARS